MRYQYLNYDEQKLYSELLNLLKQIPEDFINRIDRKSYSSMMFCAVNLQKILRNLQNSGIINIEIDAVNGLGEIAIAVDNLYIDNIGKLLSTLSTADTMSIIPAVDGGIQCKIVFRVFKQTAAAAHSYS